MDEVKFWKAADNASGDTLMLGDDTYHYHEAGYSGDPRREYPREYPGDASLSETIYWHSMRFVFKRYVEWAPPWAKRADTVQLPMSVFDMPAILKTLEWA